MHPFAASDAEHGVNDQRVSDDDQDTANDNKHGFPPTLDRRRLACLIFIPTNGVSG